MEEKKLNIEEVESETITLNQESNRENLYSNQEEALGLLRLASLAYDSKINKAYRNYIYGIGERRAVSKKEKQKKKAKRRMAKKSKH